MLHDVHIKYQPHMCSLLNHHCPLEQKHTCKVISYYRYYIDVNKLYVDVGRSFKGLPHDSTMIKSYPNLMIT